MLAGSVEHDDSLGNKGKMTAGDVQWMTAGSGILHQEMPKGDGQGRMHGFQLWANLPSSPKMTAPRYQDIPSSGIPEATDDDGTRVRVICGEFWGKKGPVEGAAADPSHLDVLVPCRPAQAARHRDHAQRLRLRLRRLRRIPLRPRSAGGADRTSGDARCAATGYQVSVGAAKQWCLAPAFDGNIASVFCRSLSGAELTVLEESQLRQAH